LFSGTIQAAWDTGFEGTGFEGRKPEEKPEKEKPGQTGPSVHETPGFTKPQGQQMFQIM
jgi:hypothetical protein